ncbi:hypothetical protein [Bradyrhizobium sp. S69]|uniref:hypothetical protein n=1 Tax=Bradyrhizobium sp. S69 TaxID=1641856 RepID=UPI00131DD701|nr:hypothetical protein [Bradyrhizobium sp. S69]
MLTIVHFSRSAFYSVAYQMIFNGKYMDEAVTPEGVFGFVVPHGNVALELIRPTVASEGIGLEKDKLNKAIRKELTGYAMKRMPMNFRQFSEATRMRPEEIRPVPHAEYVPGPH